MHDVLDRLVCEQVGVVSWINQAIGGTIFGDGTRLVSAATGDLSELLPCLKPMLPPCAEALGGVIGSGCAMGSLPAATKAVFETLERYACAAYAVDELITASGHELGSAAMPGLDPAAHLIASSDALDRCQRRYDPGVPIRWVRGYHLIREEPLWVPLVVAHTFVPPRPGEGFHSSGTAGVAAHRSLEAAVLSAWHEVVEREAVEAVWRLRLPLPRIEVAPEASDEFDALSCCDGNAFVDQRYYDATNDLGVPIVYGVRQLARPLAEDAIVGCAARSTLFEALVKVRFDASGQQAMRLHASRGAPYLRYSPETWPDFSFLGEQTMLIDPAPVPIASPLAAIRDLRTRFAALGRDVILVNLTPDELVELDVHVVRVIIPSLMPLSASLEEGRRPYLRLAEIAAHYGTDCDPYRPASSDQPFL